MKALMINKHLNNIILKKTSEMTMLYYSILKTCKNKHTTNENTRKTVN